MSSKIGKLSELENVLCHNETSMTKFVTKEQVYKQSFEFHSTNNFDQFYTDETSMTSFYTIRVCISSCM
ncbi:MAG: hypothetical protein JG782_493 [Anaerophaga sp.]|nr:hypothetical protein [Anaerophaga sp.]MDK2842721.1 hypothetical protein [Anaerophaga sp.]MDN5291300.1 hypothetical protein [Anaerophaga sp.]